jgi:lipopolysaccharide transport system permease protein
MLIFQLTKREIISRYRGSFLGILWTIINPILILAIYTFVFGFVFKVRLDQSSSSENDQFSFALLLFSGLIVYNIFSDCLSRSPGLVLANINYVKKIIFPLDILPWVNLGATLFHAAISLLVFLIALLLIKHSIDWTVIWIPVILTPFLLLTLGISWFLAATGVFVRDIGQFIGLALTMLLFLSPVFYPASALPESLRDYLFLNPLSFIIEQLRAVALYGQLPDWQGLAIYTFLGLIFAQIGFVWFEKTREGFADVL